MTPIAGGGYNKDSDYDGWSEENVQLIVDAWSLTAREVSDLWELRDRLVDVRHDKNVPKEVVRYLRERPGKLNAAERMFRKLVEWRVEEGVDTILEDWNCPKGMQKYFPISVMQDPDRDGDGIWVERPGAADAWGLYKRYGGNVMTKYSVWVRELSGKGLWYQAYRKRRGNIPILLTVVVDLDGLSLNHVRAGLIPLFAVIIRIVQDYYCGFTKRIILIREPAIFRYIWSLIRVFMDENFRNLMVFAGQDWDCVAKYVDLEALPPCMCPHAGRGVPAEGMPQHLEGGRVPTATDLPEDQIQCLPIAGLRFTDDATMTTVDHDFKSLYSSVEGATWSDSASTDLDEVTNVSTQSLFKGYWQEPKPGHNTVIKLLDVSF